MDSRKEKLLNSFTTLAQGKSNEDLLPLLLAFSQKAKEEHISFDKTDIEALVNNMKKDLSPDEYQKIEAIMKMASVL